MSEDNEHLNDMNKFLLWMEEAASYPCSCCAAGAAREMLRVYLAMDKHKRHMAEYYLGAKLMPKFDNK